MTLVNNLSIRKQVIIFLSDPHLFRKDQKEKLNVIYIDNSKCSVPI